ncbi:glycerol-3-phosphate dehydrogenase/oxidase [Achromobacter seleniivolatilans]|uniref:Glycerol-3-phosphate dehydrogenase/oxidase n=1 Tax=Achromobacter seleniivolatilans TaxID=3047478 RepID=A0ABY9M4M0_9BURK|nr:glycerol-3-phosphate dehydrogenase/oxidase [Achromobacter sp. R39]WMD21642.1 glycerol-3-phosphate dehydrogenase/oxidase [Achromobacter sp. R39]
MTANTLPYVRPALLAGRHFSTVIVGAGINGVGVFRDLSLQGVDCLVVDKGDFAAGASSAPSRMIHGGLRYLESGAFALVAEATRERNLLLRNAAHLVRPLETVVPLSSRFGGLWGSMLRFAGRSASPGARGLFVVALGLRLYDRLGRRQRVMPGHRIARAPAADEALFRDSVRWTATYFDAWISHPEWLILELMADAHADQPASLAANYCKVMACRGKTLTLRDEITGEFVDVTADTVVNATGAWLDRSATALEGAGSRVMGTKGSHLILDHPALRTALDGRMAYFETSDGRVCIVYPFMDRVLVGSTDIPVDDPDQAATEPAEVDYLLDVLREVFPRLPFARRDVVYTYVGVRPLAHSDADKPGQISRDHAVVIDPPNALRKVPLVCLVGGKWTTFRSLAALAANHVLAQLGRTRAKSTETQAIGGGADMPAPGAALDRFIDGIQASSGLSRKRCADLTGRYGSRASKQAMDFAASGDVPLRHAPDYSEAEVRALCQETGVLHLDDLVVRRTLLAIRGCVTAGLLTELADLAASALDWTATRRREEWLACAAILRDRHFVDLPVEEGAEPSGLDAARTTDLISSPITT